MHAGDLARVMRQLEPGGWLAAARRFATGLRGAGHEPGRLLVVGTPDEEPWHLTAHLDDAARLQDAAALRPVLVRWQVPLGAPPHLSVGIDRLRDGARGTTLLVATPSVAQDRLLERLDDAKRSGATLFAMHPGGGALDDLAHASLNLPTAGGMSLAQSWETASHVVTALRPDAGRRWVAPWRR